MDEDSQDGLLPEDLEERACFENTAKRYEGDRLAVIVYSLRVMAVAAPRNGSLGKVLAIYHNELFKISKRLEEKETG